MFWVFHQNNPWVFTSPRWELGCEGELPAGPWVGGCVVPSHSAGRNLNILNLIHHQLVLQHTSEVKFYHIMPSVLLGILLDSCRTFQPGNCPLVLRSFLKLVYPWFFLSFSSLFSSRNSFNFNLFFWVGPSVFLSLLSHFHLFCLCSTSWRFLQAYILSFFWNSWFLACF